MIKKKCEGCDKIISERRLNILPNTRTCVKCSKETPVIGVSRWKGKNSDGISIIPSNDANIVGYARATLYQKSTFQIFTHHVDEVSRRERYIAMKTE